jgi:Uma2 family endonuclease
MTYPFFRLSTPFTVYTGDPSDKSDDLGIYVEKPCLLIEVLSDSTAESDDHRKRLLYFKLPSLQYYILVSQEAYKVEVYERAADFWKYRLYEGLEAAIPLPLIGVELAMKAIYEDIEIEEADEE